MNRIFSHACGRPDRPLCADDEAPLGASPAETWSVAGGLMGILNRAGCTRSLQFKTRLRTKRLCFIGRIANRQIQDTNLDKFYRRAPFEKDCEMMC